MRDKDIWWCTCKDGRAQECPYRSAEVEDGCALVTDYLAGSHDIENEYTTLAYSWQTIWAHRCDRTEDECPVQQQIRKEREELHQRIMEEERLRREEHARRAELGERVFGLYSAIEHCHDLYPERPLTFWQWRGSGWDGGAPTEEQIAQYREYAKDFRQRNTEAQIALAIKKFGEEQVKKWQQQSQA